MNLGSNRIGGWNDAEFKELFRGIGKLKKIKILSIHQNNLCSKFYNMGDGGVVEIYFGNVDIFVDAISKLESLEVLAIGGNCLKKKWYDFLRLYDIVVKPLKAKKPGLRVICN